MQSAVFGGGCFWCLDAVFRKVKGVKKVETGYAGADVLILRMSRCVPELVGMSRL